MTDSKTLVQSLNRHLPVYHRWTPYGAKGKLDIFLSFSVELTTLMRLHCGARKKATMKDQAHERKLRRARRDRELNQLRLERLRNRQAHTALRWERDQRFDGVTQLNTGGLALFEGQNLVS